MWYHHLQKKFQQIFPFTLNLESANVEKSTSLCFCLGLIKALSSGCRYSYVPSLENIIISKCEMEYPTNYLYMKFITCSEI
jgi:hypothetical protein